MKKIGIGLAIIVVVLAAIVVINYPRLNIITGFSAKSVCSCTFEAERDLASIEGGDNDFDPVFYAKNVIDFEEYAAKNIPCYHFPARDFRIDWIRLPGRLLLRSMLNLSQ